jgi:hypothetical protein
MNMKLLLSGISLLRVSSGWCCVIDPSLALTVAGITLTRRLGTVMEVWIARELWHILNSIDCYEQHPSHLLPFTHLEAEPVTQATRQHHILDALHQWQHIRANLDLAKLNVFWIGDKPNESFLPQHINSQSLIACWEHLSCALGQQTQHSLVPHILNQAVQDTAALTVALQSAFILTYQSTEQYQMGQPPDLCMILESWGIACQQLDPQDSMVALRREQCLHWIMIAGGSEQLWSGLHLAMLHLVAPRANTPWASAQEASLASLPWTALEDYDFGDRPLHDVWKEAKGVWYWL